jgi:hypothetical protein
MTYDAIERELRLELTEARTEIEWLRDLVQTAMPFMNDAGNDEDPEAQATACAWLAIARFMVARAALESKP